MGVYGNAQHGGQRQDVRADVAVSKGSVVGSHVGHDAVHVRKGSLAGQARANQVVASPGQCVRPESCVPRQADQQTSLPPR